MHKALSKSFLTGSKRFYLFLFWRKGRTKEKERTRWDLIQKRRGRDFVEDLYFPSTLNFHSIFVFVFCPIQCFSAIWQSWLGKSVFIKLIKSLSCQQPYTSPGKYSFNGMYDVEKSYFPQFWKIPSCECFVQNF